MKASSMMRGYHSGFGAGLGYDLVPLQSSLSLIVNNSSILKGTLPTASVSQVRWNLPGALHPNQWHERIQVSQCEFI